MKKFKISKRVELYTVFTILILITMIGSTVSLFLKTDTISNAYYQTGLINIELIDDETGYGTVIDLNRSVPVTDEVGSTTTPYKVKITNNGTVNYNFDVQLLNDAVAIANDNCENNLLDRQYIKIKINESEPVLLSSLTNGTILTNLTIAPDETIEVTLRAWLTTNTPNSQIGKHFHVKLVADGHATYTERNTTVGVYLYKSDDTPCTSCTVSLTEILTTTTNNDGYFELSNVPVKQYNLTVTSNSIEVLNDIITLAIDNPPIEGNILNVIPSTKNIYRISMNSDKSISSISSTSKLFTNNIISLASTNTDQIMMINQPATEQTTANIEYRYYGATPDNYLYYNCLDSDSNSNLYGTTNYNYASSCEKWRIIGVFETETPTNQENTTFIKENRVKIIRDDSIGNYSWDSSALAVNGGYGINAWQQADLMTTLNSGAYWNRTSGICYNGINNSTTTCDFSSTGLTETAKGLIDKAKYYLGGGTNYYPITGGLYNEERGTTILSCTSGDYCNDTVTRQTNWTGVIGLMYPSDYGYAAGSACANGTNLDRYIKNSCTDSDWLYKSGSVQLTMTHCLSSYFKSVVFAFYSDGTIGEGHAYGADGVRPVLYLSSDVKVIDGDGTNNYPYIIKR